MAGALAPVSIAILAGGQSQRMGQDKARLVVGGVPLIDRVASILATFGPITVVGGDTNVVDLISAAVVEHVRDLHPNEGPLGGILSAISATEAKWTLVAACDLPRLDAASIGQLIHHGIRDDADVAVPLVGGQRQWHIALWNQRAMATLQAAFDGGVRSIHAAAVNLRQTTLVAANSSSYIDLDTPEDVSAFARDPEGYSE